MTRNSSQEDICFRILPARSIYGQEDSAVRKYDVAVYAKRPSSPVQGLETRTLQQFQDMQLQVLGELSLKWARYQDILAQFFEGEKGLEAMYYRLSDALSPELREFIAAVRAKLNPVCLWWISEAPELEDMPWELLFFGSSLAPVPSNFNFVRGSPPEVPIPVLPLAGPLRMLWSDTAATPEWMRELLNGPVLPGISCRSFSSGLRYNLREAANQGIELVHLCSDGSVSLAYEGLLNCSVVDEPGLSAAELSEITRGSRVSVLGLTAMNRAETRPPSESDPLSSVYRAFAYLASSRVRLPSIVAPVGPNESIASEKFWKTFYTTLGEGYRLDASFASAKQAARASTFALFLRHSHGKLFREVQDSVPSSSPSRMATDLQSSLDLTQRLEVLGTKYGALPDYIGSFAKGETDRRQDIQDELKKWTATEAEE